MNYKNLVICCLILLSLSKVSLADESGVEFYEGKSETIERLTKATAIYEKPNLSSVVIGTTNPRQVVVVSKYKGALYPGKAIVKNKALAKKYGFELGELLFYYGSIGESLQPELMKPGGKKKLYEEGFDAGACPVKDDPNFENCWLEVKSEPRQKNWRFIKYGKDYKKSGWIYEEFLVNDIPQEPGMD